MNQLDIPRPDEVAAVSRPDSLFGPGDRAIASARRRVHARALRECEAMMQHLLGVGAEVSTELFARYDAYAARATDSSSDNLAELGTIHNELAKLIAPARPATIVLIYDDRECHPFLSTLGPLPIVRHFFLLGGLSLFTMLTVALSSMVNPQNMQKGMLELSGIDLLAIEVFLLSAPSLGSCFANLQKLQSYISAGTYDPRRQGSYWTRWVMGVMAGIVLSQLLYSMLITADGNNPTKELTAALSQPALALVGGFSADLVNKVLNRIIGAIDNLLGGTQRPAA